MNDGEYASRKRHLSVCLFVCLSAGDVVSSAMEDRQDSCGLDAPTTTPVQPLPCDVDDQSASPRSPVKPEVDMRSARESPAVGLDASPGGDTCDAPTSPEQEEEQTKDDMSRRRRRLVSDDDDVIQPEPEVVSIPVCDVTASAGKSNECCSEAAARAAQCAIHDSRQASSGYSGGITGTGNEMSSTGRRAGGLRDRSSGSSTAAENVDRLAGAGRDVVTDSTDGRPPRNHDVVVVTSSAAATESTNDCRRVT